MQCDTPAAAARPAAGPGSDVPEFVHACAVLAIINVPSSPADRPASQDGLCLSCESTSSAHLLRTTKRLLPTHTEEIHRLRTCARPRCSASEVRLVEGSLVSKQKRAADRPRRLQTRPRIATGCCGAVEGDTSRRLSSSFITTCTRAKISARLTSWTWTWAVSGQGAVGTHRVRSGEAQAGVNEDSADHRLDEVAQRLWVLVRCHVALAATSHDVQNVAHSRRCLGFQGHLCCDHLRERSAPSLACAGKQCRGRTPRLDGSGGQRTDRKVSMV